MLVNLDNYTGCALPYTWPDLFCIGRCFFPLNIFIELSCKQSVIAGVCESVCVYNMSNSAAKGQDIHAVANQGLACQPPVLHEHIGADVIQNLS